MSTRQRAVRAAARSRDGTPAQRAASAVAELKRLGSARVRGDMVSRYNITGPSAEQAFGVPMSRIKALGKRLGRDHALAQALWKSGNYEARMLCSFVDDPAMVTVAQMDRWVKSFDNWAYCDALCFNLFDRTPHAFGRVHAWAGSDREFVKRTAFALLWSLALHNREAGDAPFARCLPLLETAATDERNFVKKAVAMALKAVGRRSDGLNASCRDLAERLAAATDPTARWIGRTALQDLR